MGWEGGRNIIFKYHPTWLPAAACAAVRQRRGRVVLNRRWLTHGRCNLRRLAVVGPAAGSGRARRHGTLAEANSARLYPDAVTVHRPPIHH